MVEQFLTAPKGILTLYMLFYALILALYIGRERCTHTITIKVVVGNFDGTVIVGGLPPANTFGPIHIQVSPSKGF